MNTFLLSAVTLQIQPLPPLPPLQVAIAHKPALFPRSKEIGRKVRQEYDIAALCEVFSGAVRSNILDAWPQRPRTIADGPTGIAPGKAIGSGLLTVGTNARTARTERRMFRFGGLQYRDMDYYSMKGILLTEIKTGFAGRIEIYSTHLLSGNDIPDLFGPLRGNLLADPATRSVKRMNSDRLKQVREVARFIREHHRPENVAILVGDFNIKDSDPDASNNSQPYPEMVNILGKLDLYDLWQQRRPQSAGKTANHWKRKSICRRDRGESYCREGKDDRPFSKISGERLDYLFMQSPQPSHKIFVDIAFPRRRVFFRAENAHKRSKIDVLSDHVALDTTLVVSRRK